MKSAVARAHAKTGRQQRLGLDAAHDALRPGSRAVNEHGAAQIQRGNLAGRIAVIKTLIG